MYYKYYIFGSRDTHGSARDIYRSERDTNNMYVGCT